MMRLCQIIVILTNHSHTYVNLGEKAFGKSSQQNFLLIFWDGMSCMLCSTTTQTSVGIQQRLLVSEILEIVSCGDPTVPMQC